MRWRTEKRPCREWKIGINAEAPRYAKRAAGRYCSWAAPFGGLALEFDHASPESSQRSEGRISCVNLRVFWGTTPHLLSLSPLRGEGGRYGTRVEGGGEWVFRGAPHHEPVARKRRNKLERGKPALTLALSPRRGDGGGAFCWRGQPRCRSSGWKVQGFKARTFGWENSHPNPLPFRRGEGERDEASRNSWSFVADRRLEFGDSPL